MRPHRARADVGLEAVVVSTSGAHPSRARLWRAIYPKDGISDSRFEQFELALEGEAGSRGVVIRATDALNNVVSVRGEAPSASDRR